MGIKVTLIDGITEANGYDLMSLANDIFKKDNFVLGPSDLKVTEQSPLGLGVTVAVGTCYMYIGTVPTFYRLVVEEEDLSIDGNSSGSTRYDLVCVKFDTSVTVNSDASNVGTLEIVKGTPGGGVPATPANHFALAEVEVVNAAASIADAKITDTRTFPNFSSNIHPLRDGWQGLPTIAEPTQGSATTITAPAGIDWTDYLSVGDSLQWNDGSDKVAYVLAVTSTILTVVGATVNNAAITNFKYSKIPGKAGALPFSYSITGSGGSAGSFAETLGNMYFFMTGNIVTIMGGTYISNKGSWTGSIIVSLPVQPANRAIVGEVSRGPTTGNLGYFQTDINNPQMTLVPSYSYSALSWSSISNNDGFSFRGSYKI